MAVTAVIGSAVLGAASASDSSRKAANSQGDATRAQEGIASEQAQLGRDELAFTKQQWEEMRGAREGAAERSLQISDAQLAQMKQQTDIAADYDAYNKSTFRPVEQALVADATSYDTPTRRMDAAGRAGADVETQAGNAVAEMRRNSLRFGAGDDGSTRGAGLDLALGKARMRAGASDLAVRNIEQQGWARRMDAASLGRGLPSAQATSAQIALTAGNSSAGNAQAALAPVVQGVGMVQNGYRGANASMGSAGSLYGQAADSYGRTMDSYNRIAAGAGQAAGQYAMMKWGG
jgi:hypothetical protein